MRFYTYFLAFGIYAKKYYPKAFGILYRKILKEVGVEGQGMRDYGGGACWRVGGCNMCGMPLPSWKSLSSFLKNLFPRENFPKLRPTKHGKLKKKKTFSLCLQWRVGQCF